ncbi:hypothetical protein Tco_1562675 [Tanacetum coccineum]
MRHYEKKKSKEEEQAFLDELERLKRQEKEANEEAEALRKEFAQETENLGLSFSDPTNPEQDDSKIPPLEDIYPNSSDGIFTTSSYDDKGAVADFTNLENFQTEANVIFKFWKPMLLLLCSKKISEALEDESWVDAMQDELLQFKIQKIQARLSAQGHMHEEGIGYDEVFQMDVKVPSFMAKMMRRLYVSQPQEVVNFLANGTHFLAMQTKSRLIVATSTTRQNMLLLQAVVVLSYDKLVSLFNLRTLLVCTDSANFSIAGQSYVSANKEVEEKKYRQAKGNTTLKARDPKIKKQAKTCTQTSQSMDAIVSLERRLQRKEISKITMGLHKEYVSKLGGSLAKRPIVSTDGSKVSIDKQIEGTDEQIKGTDEQSKGTNDHTEEGSVAQTTQKPTSTIFGDDETIAKVLLNMSQAKACF